MNGRPRRHWHGEMSARFPVYGNERGGCGGTIRQLWVRVGGKLISVGEICDRCGGTLVEPDALDAVSSVRMTGRE